MIYTIESAQATSLLHPRDRLRRGRILDIDIDPTDQTISCYFKRAQSKLVL